MGTPAFAVPSLKALLAAGYDVKAVFTQPDRPVGRGKQIAMPPVKEAALEAGIPVHQPQRLRGNEEALATLQAIAPDLIVVVAYGQILPESILNLPPFGCINVHASLLPRYRGAAPIQWSILHGDAETGVATMQMEKGLDTGPMLMEARTPIGADETADALSQRLSEIGAQTLVDTLGPWFEGTLKPTPQDDALATYAPMLTKAMAELDWRQGAQALHQRIRALHPWPGTTTKLGDETVKILKASLSPRDPEGSLPGTVLAMGPAGWEIACGSGVLRIEQVQLPNKKAQSSEEAARGWRAIAVGSRFEGSLDT
ncbi:methionyl-tRNA formyltransferase [bacterium]|nr:methionyl-tRNA formyltransferase [bacterium]